MKRGLKSLLYFHQGWTDIVNCLPLIHYYSHYKSNLDVIVRIDARDFIEYTCRGLKNVSFIYLDKLILDNTVDFSKLIPEYEEYETLLKIFINFITYQLKKAYVYSITREI